MNRIAIANDGVRIVSTDYWSSEPAARGFAYLSINAGALRLLLPRGWPELLRPEVVRASAQIVGAARTGVIHIVLEDGTESPAYLTLDARQCDRALPESDLGREVPLLAYGPGATAGSVRLLRELPAKIDPAGPEPR